MNQLCSTTPDVSLCDLMLHQGHETSIKKPLITAYVFHDIDLGDEVIQAGESIEIIAFLEGSIYLARRGATIFAVSERNEVRLINKRNEG